MFYGFIHKANYSLVLLETLKIISMDNSYYCLTFLSPNEHRLNIKQQEKKKKHETSKAQFRYILSVAQKQASSE